jgi:hypothetical protein
MRCKDGGAKRVWLPLSGLTWAGGPEQGGLPLCTARFKSGWGYQHNGLNCLAQAILSPRPPEQSL